MTDFTQSTRRTVSWIRTAVESGQLEVKPPYQRNPVWLDPQKSSLIDTILHGYPIPELYMQDVVDPDGNERHYLVDGQQRIRACMGFIDGEFELDPKESSDFAGLSFDDLSPDERQRFWSYPFIVRLMPNMSEEELRGIFKRINRYNIALNKQELRHATYWGEFISTMEELAQNDFWVESGIFSANDFRRMLDVEFISELSIAALHGPQNKKASLDRWYEVYEKEFEEKARIITTFNRVTGEMREILPDLKSTRWRRTSDFYSLFAVLASHERYLPLTSTGRAEARARLTQFGAEVTAALSSDPKAQPKPGAAAKRYAKNVERAASDLGRRLGREEEITSLLSDVWDG